MKRIPWFSRGFVAPPRPRARSAASRTRTVLISALAVLMFTVLGGVG